MLCSSARVHAAWRKHKRMRSYPLPGIPSDDFIPGNPATPIATKDLECIIHNACTFLKQEHVERAHLLAAQQLKPVQTIVLGDTEEALAFGVITRSESGLPPAARLDAALKRHLLLELGQALSMVGEYDVAVDTLGSVASCFVDSHGAHSWTEASHRMESLFPTARHFEREVFKHWAEALQRSDGGHSSSVAAVNRLAVSRGVFQHQLQVRASCQSRH